MDVVDHQLDVAGRPHVTRHERGEHAHPAEDEEADRSIPVRGPQRVLQEVDHEQVGRADEARRQTHRHHERGDARRHSEDSTLEPPSRSAFVHKIHRSTIYFVPTQRPTQRPTQQVVTDRDYQALLGFRTELRRFLHWSEEQARETGLTPAQHQLLLAVRGHAGDDGPTVGDVAEALLLKHHSAVGLVDRTARAGLITRRRDANDHRIVRLRLTADGSKRLAGLSRRHLDELRRLRRSALDVLAG